MKQVQEPAYRPYPPFLQEFIMNGADGIVIAFAVAIGLLAAHVPAPVVLKTTLLIMIAASVIFGLAAFFAAKIEIKHFYTEMQPAYQQLEDEKEIRLLENIGLGTKFQHMALEEIEKDRRLWAQMVADFELHELSPHLRAPGKRGLFAGLSFFMGAILPLLPYFLADSTLTASIVITALALPLMGYLKYTLTGGTALGASLSSLLTGALAGAGAYLVALVFV